LSIVSVAPEISMPNRRLGQAKGRETILECIITAFPHAVNYWEKDGRRISSSAKHRIEAYDDGEHTIVLSLRIHDIDQSDYGEYKCVASNPLGQDQQVMYLYGIQMLLDTLTFCTSSRQLRMAQ
jgi:Immunoglobulin I-set domain